MHIICQERVPRGSGNLEWGRWSYGRINCCSSVSHKNVMLPLHSLLSPPCCKLPYPEDTPSSPSVVTLETSASGVLEKICWDQVEMDGLPEFGVSAQEQGDGLCSGPLWLGHCDAIMRMYLERESLLHFNLFGSGCLQLSPCGGWPKWWLSYLLVGQYICLFCEIFLKSKF